MRTNEVRKWLESLGPDDLIAIDEGGLTLVVIGSEEEAYLEIGGVPLDDDGWEGG